MIRELSKALANKAETKELSLYDYPEEAFPIEIYELENLEYLSFCSELCKAIPDGISRCSKLKILRIEGEKIAHLPADMGNLAHLSKLELTCGNIENLPDSLSKLQAVSSFLLSADAVKTLPDLSGWTAMQKLTLACKSLLSLPNMQAWKQLENLDCSDSQISEIAEHVFELPELTDLFIINNKIKALPPNFYKAPKLERFELTGSKLEKPPVEVIYMENLCKFYGSDLGFHPSFSEDNYDFFYSMNKMKSPMEYRLSMFHIFCNNKTEIEQMPNLHLAEALRSDSKTFYVPALIELSRRAQSQVLPEFSPKKGDEIAALGKNSFKKTELKDKLKNLEIKYVNKITETTRYVILGAGLDDIDILKQYKLFFITDRDLDVFLKDKEDRFLLTSSKEESQKEQQNLSQMLLSRQPDTVEVAVQLLKTGGVPKELITDLFLMVKDPSAPEKARKMGKSLLELNASPALVNRIGDKKQLFLPRSAEESTLDNNISFYASGTELDSIRMAIYLFQQTGFGYRHWLRLSPPEKRREILTELFKNPNFVLGFYDCYCINSDLFPFADIITRISFDGVGNRTVPKEVYSLPNLTYLSFRQNCIKKFKPEFAKLSKLQELNLSFMKTDEAFPDIFIQMPQLQRIVVEGCLFISTSDVWKEHYTLDSTFPKKLIRK